jgi:hypothetical protein
MMLTNFSFLYKILNYLNLMIFKLKPLMGFVFKLFKNAQNNNNNNNTPFNFKLKLWLFSKQLCDHR